MMLFDLAYEWEVGPIVGNARLICGHAVEVAPLDLCSRYDVALELITLLQDRALDLELLQDPALLPFIHKLVEMTNAPEELFDDDLTLQFPVALTALAVHLDGFFDPGPRMALAASRHRAVRKAFRQDKDFSDAKKIGPHAAKYWFLYRPVMSEVCTFAEMFVEERFTFLQIHRMHEMLDVQQFNEIVANEVPAT